MFRLWPLFFCSLTAWAQDGSIVMGRVEQGPLTEISGVTVSQKHPGIFYTHNDSGDKPRFFAITGDGTVKGEFRFKGSSLFKRVRDCEDIAVGPGPVEGQSYIYLADIGDNAGLRSRIIIYRFEEPSLDSAGPQTVEPVALDLNYPDGPRDAETMIVDPLDKALYIFSKRKDSVTIYTAPLDWEGKSEMILKVVGKIFFEGRRKEKWLVAGDVSPDGKQVLMKTMNAVYYWDREPGEHLYEALMRKPLSLPYQSKGQEEAICFSQDQKGFIIIAEGRQQPVRYFSLPSVDEQTTLSKQVTER